LHQVRYYFEPDRPARNMKSRSAYDTIPSYKHHALKVAQTNYDYINKRIDGTSYVLDKPLAAGTYGCTVTAYNQNDVKLADSPDDIKFIVTGGGK
jgi:hypothetical protein